MKRYRVAFWENKKFKSLTFSAYNGQKEDKHMKDYDFEKAKRDWRELNREEDSIPLYMKDWYWDAVCNSPDDWSVICVKKNNQVEAAFPFLYTKRKGLRFIELPWQVAAAGIWIRNRDISNKGKALVYLTDIVNEIIRHLPKYDSFKVNFNHLLWTWHPFYWMGFEAMPRYTSVIRKTDSGGVSAISKRRKRSYRNAVEKYNKVEVNGITPDEYWDFFLKSYDRRAKTISYERNNFLNLVNAAMEHNACELRDARKDGNLVAVNVVLYDEQRAYYQFLTHLPGIGDDAQTYITLDAIEKTLENGKTFDFEGSMIHGVCEYYMSWNPELEVNYLITKYSRKYRLLRFLKVCLWKR